MSKLSELAKAQTTLSKLMEGREKITVEDVINQYKHGISVCGVDIINLKSKKTKQSETVPVLIFAEDKTKFMFGGKIIRDIVNNWYEFCEGSIDDLNNILRENPVKMKFAQSVTNDGNQITLVDIID